MSVRIGIVGDYNPDFVAHTTTDSSLKDAAESLGLALESSWLPTPSLSGGNLDETLAATDGLWISAGSPYASRDGAFAAIRWARERDWPLVAT
jgi:CTP synthase (UTP-ammonia lyase)